MSSSSHIERVLYECSCLEWAPLSRLSYCRHCSVIRCAACTANEMDCIFCGTCLENVPVGEARVRKNQCINCRQCPICASTLSAHNSGEAIFLSCSTCKWSTLESDIKEQPTAGNWKMHENVFEKELSAVVEQMKNYEVNEKAQRDIMKRRSNVGSRLTDRFGLQQMYQKRKQAMERPTWLAPQSVPVTELDELPSDMYTTPVDISKSLSLDSRLRQPLVGEGEARPVRMPLKGRRVLRCLGCDRNLSKLEYSPSSIIFKIQYFARTYVPEIKLSQETTLSVGNPSPVLISVNNESVAKADVVILADNEENSVECNTPVVEFSLPPNDETAEIYTSDNTSNIENGEEVIVFRKRHRVGLNLSVTSNESKDKNILSLVLKWRNELTSMTAGQEWRMTRVRILLGKS